MPLWSGAAQVITVFFGSFVVGSFFSQFNQWIDNPSSAVNLIGTAVPQVCPSAVRLCRSHPDPVVVR